MEISLVVWSALSVVAGYVGGSRGRSAAGYFPLALVLISARRLDRGAWNAGNRKDAGLRNRAAPPVPHLRGGHPARGRHLPLLRE